MLFCRRVALDAAKFWLKKTAYALIVLMKSILFLRLTAKNADTRLKQLRIPENWFAAPA